MEKKVAIQLRDYEPWQLTAKIMSEVGFNSVAMLFDDHRSLLKDDWKGYVESIGEVFDKYGLKCIQTHAPYYNLLLSAEKRDPEIEEGILRSMEATKILGAEVCAVHPRSYIIDGQPRETAVDREKSLKENIKSFLPAVEACEKHGVMLGIENLMRYPNEHPYFYSWIVDDQIELIDKLASKNVCAVWDFGHANLVDDDHAERIKKLGSRIKGTHVHNNDAINDCHYPPFIPDNNSYYVKRSVNWNSTLKALKSTGYNGYLTLETVFDFKYSLDTCVKYLYDSVNKLADIMEGKDKW